jgi:4'-phosphopantetheinyl transferase EntD
VIPAADPAVAMVPVPPAPAREAWERAHLSAAEAALLGERAAEKRRAEFVAGRLAAKAAAALLLGPPFRREDVVILRDGEGPTGPPRVTLSCGEPSGIDASISHADRLAVAAASRCAVGVDLVAVEDHGPAFETEAFAPGELEAWCSFLGATSSRPASIAIAFGAKEAALKWSRRGLTVPLHEVTFRPATGDAPAEGTAPVLALDGTGCAGVVHAPEIRLRVAVGGRDGAPALVAARILHLWSRVVFLVWGPRAREPQRAACAPVSETAFSFASPSSKSRPSISSMLATSETALPPKP